MLEVALEYVGRGWPVFPIHSVDSDGVCSCSKGIECGKQAGKHPKTANGLHGATTDVEQIKRWFGTKSPPNIGLVTGARSGLYVIDVDPKDGGPENLAQLEASHEVLPSTVTSRTGSSGRHYFFKHQHDLPNSQGKVGFLGPGLDTRGEGGYVVAAPSRHRSGASYGWLPCLAPGDVPLAELPSWVLDLHREHAEKARTELAEKYRKEVNRSEKSRSTFEAALAAYNKANARDWPDHGSACPAPGCPSRSGFKKHPKSGRWACWNPEHPTGIGTRAPNGHTLGDAADLDAALAGRTLGEHLIGTGYLTRARFQVPYDASSKDARLLDPQQSALGGPKQGGYRPLTDLGNAERLVEQHGHDLRHVWAMDAWFAWDGRRWAQDSGDIIERTSHKVVRSIPDDVARIRPAKEGEEDAERIAKEEKAILKWAASSESHGALTSMVRRARSLKPVPIKADQLDADPWVLNLKNGTLDLQTGELVAPRREDHITKVVPIDFDTEATCPTWERFLEQVSLGDPEWGAYLQRAVGYSLTGSTNEEAFFILWGSGKNGKSRFMDIIGQLLGSYAVSMDAGSFEKNSRATPGGPRPDLLRLRGARASFSDEIERSYRFNEALVKQLVSGVRFTCRGLNADPVEFIPQAKLWLAFNPKPRVNDSSEAFWRRVRLIPFEYRVPDDQVDMELKEKLRAELPGILNWALRGLEAWAKGGLGTCARITAASAGWREESDQVKRFIEDMCVVAEGAQVETVDLFHAYRAWSDEVRIPDADRLTLAAFGTALNERGFEKKRVGSKDDRPIMRVGIGLRSDRDDG
jgi:putative DNA primase/helicase